MSTRALHCREKHGEPTEANIGKWCDDCWREFKGYGYLQDEKGQHTNDGITQWCDLCGAPENCTFALYDKEGNKM